jgi:hypothetical protein
VPVQNALAFVALPLTFAGLGCGVMTSPPPSSRLR